MSRDAARKTVMLSLFGLLIFLVIIAGLSTDRPSDLIVSILDTALFTIFIFVLFFVLGGLIYSFLRLSQKNSDKTFSEQTYKNYEISREKSQELAASIKKFYADYKTRKNQSDEKHKDS